MGNSRFYSALAALFFAAFCAYGAAALFNATEKAQPLPGHNTAGAEICRQELILLGAGRYCAAIIPEDMELKQGSCQVSIKGSNEKFPAGIIFSSRCGALLRIENDNNSLPRGLFRAELIT